MAESIRRDEAAALVRQINARLSPLSAAKAYDQCWAYQIAGDEPQALAVLRRCAARGVPLPIELPASAEQKPTAPN